MGLTSRQVRLLLPLGAGVALSLTGDSTLYAVLPNQAAVMGISLASVGVMLGVNRLIRIPANPLSGSLYDRGGRKKLFLLGLILGVLSTLSYSVAHGFWPLLAGRLLWGLAWSLINVGGYVMVLDWSASADRGRMAGLYQISYMVGLSLSPILGGTLTDLVGFRQALRLCALISSLGLAVALVALPETASPPSERRVPAAAVARPSLGRLWQQVRTMDRRLLLVAYVYLLIFFTSNGILMSTVSLYLRQRWGEQIVVNGLAVGVSSLAGVMLALRALLGIAGGPVAGILSDRMHSRLPVAAWAVVTGSFGFGLLALSTAVWLVPVGVSLVALSAGALLAVLTALVGDLSDGGRGLNVGALATAGDIGSASGPLLAYALLVRFELQWVYLFCAVALGTGLLALRAFALSPEATHRRWG